MIIELMPDAPRVSLRHVAPDGGASDIVGHLVAADEDRLVVLPETKPLVVLQRASVQQMKRVPERTVLPASPPDALQRVLDRTWPGLRRARLGGWVLRASHGKTRRANSILVGGDPGYDWREAVSMADSWHGSPMCLQVVTTDPVVDDALAQGYRLEARTVVMVARTDDLPFDTQVQAIVREEPDADWLAIWRDGNADEGLVAELTASPAWYAVIPGIAAGRIAVNGAWSVISCVEVVPRLRKSGWGRTITRALINAVETRFVALQVGERNEGARALYAKEGFVEHHTYAYLVR